jgi:hypothetical protein
VKRDALENFRIKPKAFQKLQPVEKAVGIGRIATHFKLAQPDKPADLFIDHFCQKGLQPITGRAIEAIGNPQLDPTLGGNQRIGTETFNRCNGGQDNQSATALFHKPPRNIFVAAGVFGRRLKPSSKIAGRPARKGLIAVNRAQGCKVFVAGFFAHRIVSEVIRPEAKLSG